MIGAFNTFIKTHPFSLPKCLFKPSAWPIGIVADFSKPFALYALLYPTVSPFSI